MSDGKLWILCDRYGNEIYLTQERGEHIIDLYYHPEMEDFMAELQQTLQQGKRTQDTLNPQKYRYTKAFDNLEAENTHIVVIVLFRCREGEHSQPVPNHCIVTAYQKKMGSSMTKEPALHYDETSDTLSICFSPGEKATGIELHESILLRLNPKERRAVGIVVTNYSYLAQPTQAGFRSVPLSGLDSLSSTLRDLVLEILVHSPVKEFLSLSTDTPTLTPSTPIVSLRENQQIVRSAGSA